MEEIRKWLNEICDFYEKADSCTCYLQKYNKKIVSVVAPLNENAMKSFLEQVWEILRRKVFSEEWILQEYPNADYRNDIEYISAEHEGINNRIEQILESIEFECVLSEGDVLDHKFDGYAFQIRAGEQKLTLLAKKNPIINLKQRKTFKTFWTLKEGGFDLIADKLLQLVPYMDTVIWKNNVYFLTPNMQKILGLRNYNQRQKEKCIEDVKAALPEAIFEQLKETFLSRQARYFISYNKERLDNLVKISQKPELAARLQVTLDDEGNMILNDDKVKNNILKYLQDRIGMDIDAPDQNVYSLKPMQHE